MSTARSVITDRFDQHEIAGMSAYMGLAWSMSPMFAPILAGYLDYVLSWKVSFYVLSGYALSLLILIPLCKETNSILMA